MGGEVLHEEGHASCQADRTQEGAGTPDGDECLLDQRAVPGRTVPVDVPGRISHEDTVSQEQPLSCLVQDTSSILPAIPVDSQKSSSMADFFAFPALRYACALTMVSFFRSWNHPSDWTNILGEYALRIGPTCSGAS